MATLNDPNMASRYWGERNSDYQTARIVHANCLCIVFGCTVKEAGSAESLTQGKWKLSEATPQGIGGRGMVITGQHMSQYANCLCTVFGLLGGTAKEASNTNTGDVEAE